MTIPQSIKKPGVYTDIDTSLAATGLPGNAQKLLIIAPMTTGTATADEPVMVFDSASASALFGDGSVAHQMASAALTAFEVGNLAVELTVCPIDDAAGATAATGTATVAGTATGPGSATLTIAGVPIEIGVATGDTAAEIAAAVSAKAGKTPSLPVTVAVNGTTPEQLDITAKNGGTLGNGITLSGASTAAGVSLAIVAMAGGAVDASITGALAATAGEQFHDIVTPFADDATIDELIAHIDTVSGALEQKPAVGFAAVTGALAASAATAEAANHPRMAVAALRGTPSPAWVVAAVLAAVDAGEQDPAIPRNTLALPGVIVPAMPDRYTRAEQESLLAAGITPVEVDSAGTCRIVRLVSTYRTNPQGVTDETLFDLTTIKSLDYVRKAIRTRLSLRFPRSKFPDTAITAIRSETIAVALDLADAEIVHRVEALKDRFTVTRAETDPTRAEVSVPAAIVPGLHVIAAEIVLFI